jgi:hypothetical protein
MGPIDEEGAQNPAQNPETVGLFSIVESPTSQSKSLGNFADACSPYFPANRPHARSRSQFYREQRSDETRFSPLAPLLRKSSEFKPILPPNRPAIEIPKHSMYHRD